MIYIFIRSGYNPPVKTSPKNMNIPSLLQIELSETVSVANKPFHYVGRADIKLDDGTLIHWLYNDDDEMLAVAPKEEELKWFEKIEDEIEPSDLILYRGNEYEFSYEDAGIVMADEGDSPAEKDDRYLFSDYESQDGEILRLVTSENTGHVLAYFGKIVSEDDVVEL